MVLFAESKLFAIWKLAGACRIECSPINAIFRDRGTNSSAAANEVYVK